MEQLLIKNGTIFNGSEYVKKDVLFIDKQVAKIEENIVADTPRVFDATGMLVLAGLIDTHMHMKNVTADIYGTDASATCFPHGVTCAVEASACFLDESFLEKLSVKNRVFVANTYLNNTFDISRFDYKRYGKHCIGLKVFTDIGASEMTDITPLKQTCDYAKDHNLKVMVHTSNSAVPMMEIVKTLNKGDIITHAFHGGQNNASMDNFDCLLYAKEKGVIVDVGFAGYVHTNFKILKDAVSKNIYPDTLGTDVTRSSAFIRSGRYGMNYCMSIMRAMGMPQEEIFKAVTVNSAKALDMQDEWGILDIGSTDACVLSLTDEAFSMTDRFNNTVSDNKSYRAELTVVNGDAVYRR